MFEPQGYSLKIFKERYAFTEHETWQEACKRVSKQMALAELPDKQQIYENKFYEILVNNLFVPGGRIWYNSGRNNPQLLNCFVLSNELDSKVGWGNIAKEMIITSMTGGGCGIDFSDVRPKGALIGDQKGECPGPVELMRLIDNCAQPVRSGGQRRVALMFSLDLKHPDIEEFLDAKLVKGQLQHANVSVRSNDTTEFIKAVKKDLDWELSWKGKYKKIVKAKAIWEKISKNAYNSAEPGFLNLELANKESNISYKTQLITSNPCQPNFAKLTKSDGSQITMGDLKIGDSLINCEGRETIVVNKWSNGIKPVYAYGIVGGSFIGTSTHKVLVKDASTNNIYKLEIDIAFNHSNYLVSTEKYGWQSIDSKVYLGEHEVFDITVSDETHTYTTNGIHASNCGEILMPPYDSCCLGHLVLPKFIEGSSINWEMLGETIRTSVRFLDNVLTVNHYPLPEMKEFSRKYRRIGLGVTGLADCLVLLGYKYGSEDGNKFIDKLFRFISKNAYETSVFLAVEKGAFPECDNNKILESGYINRLTPKLKSLIKDHGLRNCALLTMAPTGTVSILSDNCSSGIEPIFSPAYIRKYWVKEKRESQLVFHPLFEKFMKEGKSIEHFISSHQLTVKDHLEVQKIVQKYVDNAVSKTINIARDYPYEDVQKLWLEYLPFLKGTTFYREDSRGYINEQGLIEDPPLVALSLEDAKRRFKEEHAIEASHTEDCIGGICEL